MSTRITCASRLALALILLHGLAACSRPSIQVTPSPSETAIPSPVPTHARTVTPSPIPKPTETSIPRISRTVDLTSFQTDQGSGWVTQALAFLPETTLDSEGTFEIQATPIPNRREGAISPTLISSYMFIQFGEISPNYLEKHAGTLQALFIRSAGLSFVDYPGDRVLDWDERSSKIPLNVRGMIKKANELNLPVFLEINYSDYIPGPIGSGPAAVQSADNIANTISYLESLQTQGLLVEGVTFGDEIDDEAGFGKLKPTFWNSDLIDRYIAYSKALKTRFPDLKIHAFDSYIAATRGLVSQSLDLLQQIRDAEIQEGMELIDGFVFRESYVFMDENGQVLDSQFILDDIESLAGREPVRRYDVFGNRNPRTDRGYLVTLVKETRSIFQRDLEIGITEYLPAGPVQINESDTSIYEDIDFLIHYADLVGTYAEQGLDIVSTWMFANDPEQSKCYIGRNGIKGLNYPVHEQLAQHFKGSILQVDRPAPYSSLRVKVYVAKEGGNYFILLLNKDVRKAHAIRLVRSGEFDLTLNLPAHSYTSLLLQGNEITITGIASPAP